MAGKEVLGSVPPQDLEFLNKHKPSPEVINRLKQLGAIRQGSSLTGGAQITCLTRENIWM